MGLKIGNKQKLEKVFFFKNINNIDTFFNRNKKEESLESYTSLKYK